MASGLTFRVDSFSSAGVVAFPRSAGVVKFHLRLSVDRTNPWTWENPSDRPDNKRREETNRCRRKEKNTARIRSTVIIGFFHFNTSSISVTIVIEFMSINELYLEVLGYSTGVVVLWRI